MNEFSTKEMIKERLWRYAEEKWHIDRTKSFDPFIELMFGGLSHEVEKIYHTIQEGHNQVFNHLTDILLPDYYSQPSPAHAVLSVKPESYTSINELDIFFDDDKEKFSYSPAGHYDLIPAEIVFMAHGKELFSITDKLKKESRFSFQIGKELPQNTVFIGIKTGTDFNSESCVFNLYFQHLDLNNLPPYDYLPLVQLAHNDHPLSYIKSQQPYRKDNIFKMQMSRLGLDLNIDQKIFRYYQSRFIQFDLKGINLSRSLPSQLLQNLPTQASELIINEKCLWIKMELPDVWVPYIKSTICLLNCLPVINRKLEEKKETYSKPIVIVQLEDKNHNFLSLYSLLSGDRPYTILDEENQNDNNVPGSFQIVSGGVQSMDTRTVSTMIHHILDVVEESGQVDRSTSTIENYEAIRNIKNDNPSTSAGLTLIIHNKNATNYILKYWTTPVVTGLIPGNRELNTGSAGIKEKKGILVTDPIGAKPEPSMGQRLKKLRYGLLSRDRICTEEDIKSFIKSQFYEFELKNISIEPVVIKINGSGLSRAWSVFLDDGDSYKSNAKFIYLVKETEQLLNEKSTGLIPILLKY